jgi:peroxiredoxin
MKARRIGYRAILLLFACFVGGTPAFSAPQQTLPEFSNQPAPEFELQDIEGETHRLSDYRGKVVVLNFWATWCPPCRYEMPSMERARKLLEDEPIAILAVDVGEDEDAIFMFTGDYPVEFPLLMDRDESVIKSYPVIGLPTTYVIDPEGYIRYRAVGSREWDDPALLDQLRALLKNQ